MSELRGTTHDQNLKFKNKEAKLLRTMQFPDEFNTKVDMRKVELAVMKPWIAQKVVSLLGFEDEVVIEYVHGLLEDDHERLVDAKKMQIMLTGFLEKKTPEFMQELWRLLLAAQSSPLKVPPEFIEQKKIEMQKRQEESERAIARREQETQDIQQGERRINEIRQRERADRPPRERDNGYRNRGGRTTGGEQRPRRRFEDSPSRRSRSRSPPPRRARDDRRSRSRSPPYRARSRSRTPERRRRRRDDSPPPRSRSRSRDRRRRRSPSPSRSRSPSVSHDRRRAHQRDPSRSRSPSPPRRQRDARRRSPSVERPRERRPSIPERQREDTPDYSASARQGSKTPVYRAATPPAEGMDVEARESDLKERLLKDKIRSRQQQ